LRNAGNLAGLGLFPFLNIQSIDGQVRLQKKMEKKLISCMSAPIQALENQVSDRENRFKKPVINTSHRESD
jgi:hypothetical protein